MVVVSSFRQGEGQAGRDEPSDGQELYILLNNSSWLDCNNVMTLYREGLNMCLCTFHS